MRLVDLSVVVNKDTPAYPGDPVIKIETTGVFEKDGYNDHLVSFDVHSSGTHIDAPLHMIDGGQTLDKMPIEQFSGPGKLVEVKNNTFELEKLKQADIQAGDIVLFKTGFSDIYHKPEYFEDYPEIPAEIANYLIDKKVKMVGMDMCSPDHPPFKIHRILLGAGVLIIENLTNLAELVGKDFTVYALPLKLQLDGAPARVIAEVK